MLKVCKELFLKWNEDVRYCHWKSNEHLVEGLDGITDLDVFVIPADKEIAEAHLIECQFIKFRPQICNQYPLVDEWMGFDKETGNLIHVHLHYQIITGTKFCKEYIYPLDDIIIRTRQLDEENRVYVTSPDLEIIILYTRIALKATNKKCIKTDKDQQKEIDYLKTIINSKSLKSFCDNLLGESSEKLYELISKESLTQEEWYEVYKIAKKWLSANKKYNSLHALWRAKYYRVKNKIVRVLNKRYDLAIINKKTLYDSKVSICFLGQDGSGKSTVSLDIEKWLRWKIEAHRFYLGSGEHYSSLFKSLLNYGNKINSSNPKTVNVKSEVEGYQTMNNSTKKRCLKKRIGGVINSLNLVNIAKRAYKETIRADKYSMNGGIPLFDRFPQMQYSGINDGPKIRCKYLANGENSIIQKYLAKREEYYLEQILEHQPSLIIKLMLSPEESIRRKPFENLALVSKKHEIIKNLKFDNSEVFIVDAMQDYKDELLLIKRIIWDHLVNHVS